MKKPFFWRSKLYLVLAFCLMYANTFSQDLLANGSGIKKTQSAEDSGVALVQAFDALAKQFQVNFSYEAGLLDKKYSDVRLEQISKTTLEESIDRLLLNTDLRCEQINNEYYVIYQVRKKNKFLQAILPEVFKPIEKSDLTPRRSITLVSIAQNITVNGVVKDQVTNEPLPGVNIIIEGTTLGTTTDVNGRYSIEAPSGSSILVFSYVGYITERVAIQGRTQIDLIMITDVEKLEEVVVIGYGTQKKSDLTGAVASVSEEKLKGSISSGIDQALQGRAAGVSIMQNSGQPGASVTIRIRGTNTINSGAEPLYVIDGVPVSSSVDNYNLGMGAVNGGNKSRTSALSGINPADIVSVEILKDASATAIYGSRGANGVILITTKRGKANDAKITYEGYYGVQTVDKYLDVMNLREFAAYQNQVAAETEGQTPKATFADPSLLGEGTNWQKAIFQTAPMQSHQLSVSGGSDKNQYAMSAGYFKQDGIVVGSWFDRYSMKLNMDSQVKSWIKIGNSFLASSTKERMGMTDHVDGIVSLGVRQTPDIPVYNFDGSYAGPIGEGAISGSVNPIGKALDQEHILTRNRALGNLYADVKIYKSLSYRSEIGGDLTYSDASSFVPTYKYGIIENKQNSISKTTNSNFYWQWKNYITFNDKFWESHDLTVMLGQEMSEWSYKNLSASRTSLASNDIHELGIGDGTTATNGGGRGSGALNSYFGRMIYNFKDRYSLTFTYRADGSSNFGPENRWAYFPSFAAYWRVSNESFMQNINDIVSNFKIRFGWGQTGNQSIPGYAWGSSLKAMNTNLGTGYLLNNFPNPYVRWEANEQVNIGADITLIRNRVELTFDYYNKLAKDMIMQLPLPGYMGSNGNGSISSPWGNYGKLENKGFEISLVTHNLTGSFVWDTDISFSRNKNKLLDLGLPDKNAFIDGKAQWFDLISITKAGQSLGEFYGYKVDRIFKDKTDILNSPVQPVGTATAYPVDGNGNVALDRTTTVWPGDIKFVDINNDNIIDIKDRVNLGSPHPKFTFGVTNSFSYKGFDLSIFVTGSYGGKIFNYMGRRLDDMKSLWSNQLKTVNNRAILVAIDPNKNAGDPNYKWYNDADNVVVSNPGTDMPRATSNDPNQNTRISDRYIEDGSYLKIKNLSIGYNVPESVIRYIKVRSLKVYANVQNVATFTKYTGYDPEIGEDLMERLVYGLDNGRYPTPRIYTIGLSLGF